MVLDVPRSTDPSLAGLLARCDHVVLVVRSALGGVAAAARTAARLRAEGSDVSVVVRWRRGSPSPEDVARAVGLPLVAELRDRRPPVVGAEVRFGPGPGIRHVFDAHGFAITLPEGQPS